MTITVTVGDRVVVGGGGGGDVSVATYCAGDGTTDDTAGIDAAIAATPEGGVLAFPGGFRWKTGGGHLIDKQMTIRGPGAFDQFYSNGQVYLANGANADLFTIAAPNVTIESLSVYGNSPHQSATSRGIVTTNSGSAAASYFTLRNLRVEAFYTDGIVAQPGSINSLSGVIDNVRTLANGRYGLYVSCSDVLATNLYAHQNVNSGMYFSGSAFSGVNGHLWGNGTGSTGYLDGVTCVSASALSTVNWYVEGNHNGAGYRFATGTNLGHQINAGNIYDNGYQGVYAYQTDHLLIAGTIVRHNNYKSAATSGGAGILMDGTTASNTNGCTFMRQGTARQTYAYYEINSCTANLVANNMMRATDHATGSKVIVAGTTASGNIE